MKRFFSLVILIIMFNVCFCQNIWQGGYNNFIRIEIQSGMSSIRLLKEGLLCVAIGYPPKYKLYTEFFPFKKLDLKKIVIIQNFLLNCSLLYKDAVIDNPNIGSTGHDKVFLIIKDDILT